MVWGGGRGREDCGRSGFRRFPLSYTDHHLCVLLAASHLPKLSFRANAMSFPAETSPCSSHVNYPFSIVSNRFLIPLLFQFCISFWFYDLQTANCCVLVYSSLSSKLCNKCIKHNESTLIGLFKSPPKFNLIREILCARTKISPFFLP